MNTLKKIVGLLLLTPVAIVVVFVVIDFALALLTGEAKFKIGNQLETYGLAGIAGAILLLNVKSQIDERD